MQYHLLLHAERTVVRSHNLQIQHSCVQQTGARLHRQQARRRAPFSCAASCSGSDRLPDGIVPRRALLLTAPLLPALVHAATFPLPTLAAPGAEVDAKVQAALNAALKKEVTKAPVLVRLVFHDAGTFDAGAQDGGANGSVQFELDRPENKGLKRGWRIIEGLQGQIKGTAAEGVVSAADLIPLSAAYAIQLCGGPTINLAVGRREAVVADPPGRLPDEDLSATQLRDMFTSKGFTTQQFVALMGSHTLGTKGYGDPLKFDGGEYYKQLLLKPWLNPKDEMASMIGLPADHAIAEDKECMPWIQKYAADEKLFFADFSTAFVKLANLGATWRV